jgi:RHS repeat-associated protein
VNLTVNQATPAIAWNTPSPITYGTALSSTQLDAAASVAGRFSYSPASGTVPAVGTQTLSVTLTPTDTTDYTTASQSVTLAVTSASKTTPTITWSSPAAITYGTALSATQLNATASVGGTFTYSPAAGTVLTAGAQTLSVTFTPTNTTSYNSAMATVTLTVNQVTPTITWTTPAAISYGTALSTTQLNATASVAGSLTYSPAAGAVLPVGTQPLAVGFTPNDAVDYSTASATVSLTVSKATPSISVSSSLNPSLYGEAVTFTPTWPSGATGTMSLFDGSTSLGSLMLSSFDQPFHGALNPSTNLLYIGNADSDSVTVFNTALNQPVTNIPVGEFPWEVAVNATTNTIYVSNYDDDTVSVINGNTNAVVSTISVGSTPFSIAINTTTNTIYVTNYGGSSISVINGATNTVTATIPVGSSPFGVAVNTATDTVYVANQSSASVSVINGATNTVTATIPLDGDPANVAVNQATDMIYVTNYGIDPGAVTVINGSTNGIVSYIAVGLDPDQLSVNPSTNVVYVVDDGSNSVSVISGATNAVTATVSVGSEPWSVVIDQTTNTVYVGNQDGDSVSVINGSTNTVASTVPVGDSPAGLVVNASTNTIYSLNWADSTLSVINGATNTATSTLGADPSLTISTLSIGTHSITAQYSGDTNWAAATSPVLSQVVQQAGEVITWSTPAPITYGTALSSAQLNATSSVPGTFVYSPAAGTVLTAGMHTITATFTPTNTTEYATATPSVSILVSKAMPTITWPTPAALSYGTALSSTQLDATASVAGAFVYVPAAGAVPPVGHDLLSATFTPTDTTDYADASPSVPLTVNAGPTYDTGTVTLMVNGVTAATTTYGQNSTPVTLAAGLAAGVGGSSPVTVTAVNDALYLQSTATGSASNYVYSLQVASNDSFSPASFGSASGNLDGGANQNSDSGQTVYYYDVLYQPNGNVAGYGDAVMGTWAPTYDSLNRLAGSTGSQTGNSFTNYCWSYDNWGNRTSQEASASAFQSGSGGFSSCLPQNPAPVTYNTNNQVSGGPSVPTYDPSGVGYILSDNNGDGNMYLYDAEGRICAVQTPAADGIMIRTGYVYDADGQRVAKGTITSWSCDPSTNGFGANANETDYVLDQSGNQVTEMASDANGNMAWAHTNVWADGQLIATYSAILDANNQADGALHFYLNDWLGTRRVQTDYEGVLEQTCSSLPYGDSLSCTQSTQSPTEHHFTGKERDSESGLDYMDARYYGSSMGRFMSPDPVFATVNRLADPQQWNMYSYGRNNPLSNSDPTGLDFNLTCSQNNGSTCVGGLQGQLVNGSFQATDVDMNDPKNAGAGYSDQFGNNYTGTFDQNNGVSFTNTAPGGATSSNSQFIDGSDPTTVNGSGSIFSGTQGVFNSNCGGSCEAKGSLSDLPGSPGAVANEEKMIGASLEDKLNFFGGHGKSTSYRTGDGQLTHVVDHAGGATEIHFEGHPPGRDLVNFVLHQVDAIRDFSNHQSSKEPPLP